MLCNHNLQLQHSLAPGLLLILITYYFLSIYQTVSPWRFHKSKFARFFFPVNMVTFYNHMFCYVSIYDKEVIIYVTELLENQ